MKSLASTPAAAPRTAAAQGDPPRTPPRTGWAPWLWLAVGAALAPLTHITNVVPVAAWLAPIFLLRFVRSQRARVALPVICLVGYLTALVALRGIVSGPDWYLAAAPLGLMMIAPYAVDRLLARRIGGLLGTLVFPAAVTALSFLPGIASPDLATFGATAYTQASELSLIQIVSVTGLWGLGFLIAWLAPVANDLWERGFDQRPVRRATGAFVAVLAAVLLFGGARLAFSAPTAPTVRVAAVAPDRALTDAVNTARLGPRPLAAATRAAASQRYLDPLADDLFARTRQAARGGAKIVAWSEAAAFVFKEDETALLDRARAVAREERIYLQVALISMLPTDRYPTNENRAILFDPAGALVWDYPKAVEVFDDGNRPGPGIVPTVDTPYGRLATVICADADLPALVRQAGKARADILLVPSSDWKPVAEMHSRMAVFRAVENGVALVRPTRLGTSIASDHQGRLLGYKSDYFVGTDYTMTVNVPTRGTATLYARLGDGAGWLCVLGLLVLPAVALTRRRRPDGANLSARP